MKRTYLYFFIICQILCSCTAQKRLYTKGYHIDWLIFHGKNVKINQVDEPSPQLNLTYKCEDLIDTNQRNDSIKKNTFSNKPIIRIETLAKFSPAIKQVNSPIVEETDPSIHIKKRNTGEPVSSKPDIILGLILFSVGLFLLVAGYELFIALLLLAGLTLTILGSLIVLNSLLSKQ